MESLEGGGIWENKNSSNSIVSRQNLRVLWLFLNIMYIDSGPDLCCLPTSYIFLLIHAYSPANEFYYFVYPIIISQEACVSTWLAHVLNLYS